MVAQSTAQQLLSILFFCTPSAPRQAIFTTGGIETKPDIASFAWLAFIHGRRPGQPTSGSWWHVGRLAGLAYGK